ncbi:MAG: alcohol dehydrogenase catalytic domain-containing protein [Anaerolineae bacterium]|nr:alcohol dehydrogenase catalytic domain-containing protein [Anaerolineae bacterium]MDW8099219.1 alcohol dehydrogenase catalytic domain-containing protein [Anaerolineae bacterium]
MTKSMLAAYVKAPFQFQLREVPIPQVRDDWVLVKVAACGICGTDLHAARSEARDWQPFGHEIAGIVVEVGRHVSTVKEGDRVVLESGSFCGHCDYCRNGRVDLCNKAPNYWANESMGFAEYILAPKECLVPFEGLDFETASLVEPLGVSLDMTQTADVQLGDEVLVLGLGPIGLMSIPLARRRGAARIYAADILGGKRAETARLLGADEVYTIAEKSLTDIPFRKGGVDRALVSAPPRALPKVMQVMRYGGVISYIGIEYGPGGVISFDANDFHFRKLQLRASFASPALYFPHCLQMLKDGQVDGRALISHVFPLERIAEAMMLLRDMPDQALKVIITN